MTIFNSLHDIDFIYDYFNHMNIHIMKFKNIIGFILFNVILYGYMGNYAYADYKSGEKAYRKGDFTTALKLWLPLAQKDNKKAQFQLAKIYANGRGVEKNDATAFKWYSRAAFNGHKQATFNKAHMLLNGIGTKKNSNEAFIIYYRLANKYNIVKAQNALAHAYENGVGIKKDFKMAKKWYDKAALSNDLSSQLSLANMLLLNGAKKYQMMAIFWLQAACIKGSIKALNKLQALYKNGLEKKVFVDNYAITMDWLKDSHPKSIPNYSKCPLFAQIGSVD